MTTATPKTRVLILDEDRIMLQSLAHFLRREGYDVITSDDADHSLADLQAGHADVLIADVNLPGLKPQEFLREVRKRAPHVVVVVLTGFGSIEGAVEATRLGAIDYLTKPAIDDEIRVTVEKAARQQALLFENHRLRQQLETRFGLDNFIGRDPQMQKVFDLASALSDARTTALITGEAGTGKSLLARAIHHRSARRDRPFIEVNCSVLPESLLKAELFGQQSPGQAPVDASPIASGAKPGRFIAGSGGTIHLKEVHALPPTLQMKLLRALEDRTIESTSTSEPKTIDIRFILSTSSDLEGLVADGKFRQDLFYRINIVTLHLPPLRERIGDIPMLADHFLKQFCEDASGSEHTKRHITGFTELAIDAMQQYTWPGNVRELQNAIERAVVVCTAAQIDVADLPNQVRDVADTRRASAPTSDLIPDVPMPLSIALEMPEKRIIESALKRNHFCRQATAAELDINRTTLYKKMRKYRLGGDSRDAEAD